MIPGLTTFVNTTAVLTLERGFTFGLGAGTDRLITDVQGWDAGAPMRRRKSARLRQHGNFTEVSTRDERTISVSGSYQAPDRASAAVFVDELNAYLGDGEPGTLEILDPDLGVRRAGVLLDSPDVTWRGGLDVTFTLDMGAPDPRKYGDAVTAGTPPPKAGGGLFTEPLFGGDHPGILDFGVPDVTGLVSITNQGTADTPIKMTVTGPVMPGGFTITDPDDGGQMVYNSPVLAGQYLVMDARDGTVKLNGYANRSVNLVRRSWARLAGGQSRRFLFEAPDSPDAYLEIEAAPAWW